MELPHVPDRLLGSSIRAGLHGSLLSRGLAAGASPFTLLGAIAVSVGAAAVSGRTEAIPLKSELIIRG